jgi:hypothetical protein
MRIIIPLVFCLLLPALTQAAERSNMRNSRYCEVVLSKSLTKLEVYNSAGLNKCPEALWRKLSTSEIKKQTNAKFVHLNGPRYFVFDGFKRSNLTHPKVKTFGGIQMRLGGILNIGLLDRLTRKVYKERKVDRDTTWVYLKGKPVYELIDPNGKVFVMQSYSVQKHPQTEKSLSKLGSMLDLPKGWSFKTGVLKETKTVKTKDNRAVVLQDDFNNTYQESGEDLL